MVEAAGIEPASEELAKEVSPGSAFEFHPVAVAPWGGLLARRSENNRNEAVFRFPGRPKAGFRIG